MKAKFIYVFLTCLMIGGQFSLSAQNQVNKDKGNVTHRSSSWNARPIRW